MISFRGSAKTTIHDDNDDEDDEVDEDDEDASLARRG